MIIKWFRLTKVRHNVSRASYKVLSAERVSSSPLTPLSLCRLNRMYQLVRSPTKLSSLGITVYRRYAKASQPSSRSLGGTENPLTLHLLIDVLDESLTTGQDPPVHDVLALWRIMVIHKLLARCSLVELGLTEVEVERVDPFEDDIRQDLSNTFFSESKVVSSHNWRVDEEKSDRVGTVLVDDLHWVGVVLELFAHLLSVTVICQKKVSSVLLQMTHEARTRPVTMRFFHGAVSKSCVPRTNRV